MAFGTSKFLIAFLIVMTMAGGAAGKSKNASGLKPQELDTSTRGPVAGVGIESQDVVSMTDRMMRDMLSTPVLAGRATPPRIIIDGDRASA